MRKIIPISLAVLAVLAASARPAAAQEGVPVVISAGESEFNVGEVLRPATDDRFVEAWPRLVDKVGWVGMTFRGVFVGVLELAEPEGGLERFQIDITDPSRALCIAYYSEMRNVSGGSNTCITCDNTQVCGVDPVCCAPGDLECP